MVSKVSRYARFVHADLLRDLAHAHVAHGDGFIKRFSPGMRTELALSSRFPSRFRGLHRRTSLRTEAVLVSRSAWIESGLCLYTYCRRFATKRNAQHRQVEARAV